MRRIIMMAATLLAVLCTQAQDDVVAPPTMPESTVMKENVSATYFKPMIGATYSSPRADDTSGVRGKWGLTAGCELMRRTGKYVGFSLGAAYSQQGYEIRSSPESKANISYLNFPLLFNVYPTDGICLKGGVQLGVLLKAEASAMGSPLGRYVDVDMSEAHRSTDWALPVAVCITTEIGVEFEFRYAYGISSFEKDRVTLMGRTINNDDPAHHSVFSLTMGYRFHL